MSFLLLCHRHVLLLISSLSPSSWYSFTSSSSTSSSFSSSSSSHFYCLVFLLLHLIPWIIFFILIYSSLGYHLYLFFIDFFTSISSSGRSFLVSGRLCCTSMRRARDSGSDQESSSTWKWSWFNWSVTFVFDFKSKSNVTELIIFIIFQWFSYFFLYTEISCVAYTDLLSFFMGGMKR